MSDDYKANLSFWHKTFPLAFPLDSEYNKNDYSERGVGYESLAAFLHRYTAPGTGPEELLPYRSVLAGFDP